MNKQSNFVIGLLVVLQVLVFAAGLPIGTKAPGFKVMSGAGQRLSLDKLQGKVVLLFYENKDVVEKNRPLKKALDAFYQSQDDKTKSKLKGVPIVDCTGAFFPFTGIWKDSLVKASQKENLTIYGDWDGQFKKVYQVVDKESNFYLIDQNGTIVYSLSGQADDKTITAIINKIKGAMKGSETGE